MGDILDFLSAIIDIADLHERYGTKGCLLMVLIVVLAIGLIIAVASFMQ